MEMCKGSICNSLIISGLMIASILVYCTSNAQIMGVGIASNDHCYVWYADGTVSSGHSADLDAYRAPYSYTQ